MNEPGWIIEIVGGPVMPSNPSVQLRVSATFNSQTDFAFFGARWDMLADDGLWSEPLNVFPGTHAFIRSLGTIQGSEVLAIELEQRNYWFGALANFANPIVTWEATWSTSVFTPRIIDVMTQTTTFGVYPDRQSPGIRFFPSVLEGSAFIHVIPAPPAAVLLALGALIAPRRPRAIPTRRRSAARMANASNRVA